MENPKIHCKRCCSETSEIKQFFMHTHEGYELYCFLQGDVKFFIEGTVYALSPGDLLILKKREAHTPLICGNIPYQRIVINFNEEALLVECRAKLIPFLSDRALGKENLYPAKLCKDARWSEYLEKICFSEDLTKKRLYLTLLLTELSETTVDEYDGRRDSVSEMIDYINSHLTDPISLNDLCIKFYISKAQMNRNFKKITGATVWNYILTKRLLLAKEKLQSGEAPTLVSSQCGFQNYSSFYRAYRAKFGKGPAADRGKEDSFANEKKQ